MKIAPLKKSRPQCLSFIVVKHAREEHRAAVEWLNNHTDDGIRFTYEEKAFFDVLTADMFI